MVFPGSIVTFPELYIQHPMLLHTLGKPLQLDERAEIIPGLYGGFIADNPR